MTHLTYERKTKFGHFKEHAYAYLLRSMFIYVYRDT